MGTGMVTASYCARMIIAAKAQAIEDAIAKLELVEKYGVAALPKVLEELRARHRALSNISYEQAAGVATEEQDAALQRREP